MESPGLGFRGSLTNEEEEEQRDEKKEIAANYPIFRSNSTLKGALKKPVKLDFRGEHYISAIQSSKVATLGVCDL